MVYQVKAIKAKKMNIDQIRSAIKADIKEFRRAVIFDDFRGTVKTWKNEKPNFKSQIKENKDFIITAYLVEDGSKGSKKWIFLNGGTSVRWAVMSPDWKSKTTPGTLKSGRGRGRVLAVGKKRLRRPRPGIEARNWTKIIFDTRSPEFAEIMDFANKKGVGKLYK